MSYKFLKEAFSVSDSGHKFDADLYNAEAKGSHAKAKARNDFGQEAPIRGILSGQPVEGLFDKVRSRHMDYAAKKHENNSNAYNPFGGLLTKSRMEQAETKKASMENLLDPHSAVYFRSNQLHKIAGTMLGVEEATIADVIAKIACEAYRNRVERERVQVGLAALETI